jgi:hypothetical protein
MGRCWRGIAPHEIEAARGYRGADASDGLLARALLGRFWDWGNRVLCQALPPAALSAAAFAALLLGFVAAALLTDLLEEALPPWACAASGAALAAYQTLRGVGARRAGAAPSALAQFVGRATGAVAAALAVMQAGAALDLGLSYAPLCLMLGTSAAVFLSVYEDYVAHEFRLRAINGPDEGVAALAGVSFAVAARPSLRSVLAGPPLFVVYGAAVALTVVPACVNVLRRLRDDHAARDRAVAGIPAVLLAGLVWANVRVHWRCADCEYFVLAVGLAWAYLSQHLALARILLRPATRIVLEPTVLAALLGSLYPLFLADGDEFRQYWIGYLKVVICVTVFFWARVVFELGRGLRLREAEPLSDLPATREGEIFPVVPPD